MRERILLLMLASVGIIFISACSSMFHPDTFMLDEISASPIEAFILSDFHLVEKTYDNEFIIHRGGACSIKKIQLTTNNASFTVTLNSGNGLKIMTRTDNKKYQEEQGIALEWTKSGSTVYENDNIMAKVDSVKAIENFPVKISFINEGGYYLLLADCDTIYKGRTQLPESEFYIFEAMDADVKVSGISFEQLYGFEPEQMLEAEETGTREMEEKIIIKQ